MDPSVDTDDDSTRLAHDILRSLRVAVPLLIVIWVGLIAIAVAGAHSAVAAPLAMGGAVGVLAGLFWGTWWGFVRYNREQVRRTHRH